MKNHNTARAIATRGIDISSSDDSFDIAGSSGLFVGIREFRDKSIKNVQFAVDDAVDLAYLFSCDLELIEPSRLWLAIAGEPQKTDSRGRLRALKYRGAREIHASRNQILSRVEDLAGETSPDGLMVVTFATHGLTDGSSQLLVASDSMRNLPMDTGIDIRRILKSLQTSDCRRKLLLVDSCQELVTNGASRSLSSHLEDAFVEVFRRAEGLVSMVAAPSGGLAFDDHRRRNGVFSAAILDGLRGDAPENNGFITPETLQVYIGNCLDRWFRRNDRPYRGFSVKLDGNAQNLPLASSNPEHIERRRLRERRDLALSHFDENQCPPLKGEHRDRVQTDLFSRDLGPNLEPLLDEIKNLNGTRDASRSFLWWFENSWNPEDQSPSPRELFRRGLELMNGTADQPIDYPEARRCFREAAELGGPVEKCWLASLMTENICGFDVDLEGASKILTEHLDTLCREARTADLDAQIVLGFILLGGRGLSQDLEAAKAYLEKAVDQGNSFAANALGYLLGRSDCPGGPDYAQGIRAFHQARSDGNVVAIRNLASYYEEGLGVEKDLDRARKLYEKAANAGLPSAMTRLGQAALHGTWGEPSIPEAFQWLQQSAKAGGGVAMSELGWAYLKGKIQPLDVATGVDWCERAIRKGNTFAMRYLGAVYADGELVPRDYSKTFALWELAVAHGDIFTMESLAELSEQLGNLATSRDWIQRGAEAGNTNCMVKNGLAFLNGNGVPQNLDIAAHWFAKAADAGSAWGMSNLAHCYYHGKGVPQDYQKSAQWYLQAANAGDAHSMNALGDLYYDGRGVSQDFESAAQWFAKAAEAGNVLGMSNLAHCYSSDKGVPQDYQKSAYWRLKAAKAGDALSMNSLSVLYRLGLGVSKDPELAKHWKERAIAAGYQAPVEPHSTARSTPAGPTGTTTESRVKSTPSERSGSNWLSDVFDKIF